MNREAERSANQEAQSNDESLQEARVLRRRLGFWRGIAGLLLVGAGILGVVFWQRGALIRRECRECLEQYASKAAEGKLSEVSPQVFENQWNKMAQGENRFAPEHYALFVNNWRLEVKGGERIPLAVCRRPHDVLWSSGRYVLYREASGLQAVLVTGDEADEIEREARRCEEDGR